jgi:catechol 2,3-dioxygenase-like lactoylglutathione lyase family enzyme
MFVRFSHVMVYSQKHPESVKWYCDKLGYEIDYNAPGEYASLHHKLLGRLAVHAVATNNAIGKGPMPYLLCDDIHKTIAEMRAKGIKVSEPTREGESPWFADFRDLDGNIWGIEEM